MRTRTMVMAALAACVVASMGPTCVPNKVHWSPDGRLAIIMGEDKTYLVDADGKLLDEVGQDLSPAWFADSQRFVAATTEPLHTFEQVKAVLSREQIDKLMSVEEAFRKQVLAHTGSWDNWKPNLPSPLTDPEILALWIYEREQHSDEMKNKLGSDWNQFAELPLPVHILQLWQVREDRIELVRKCHTSLQEIHAAMQVSPDGSKVAFVEAVDLPTIGSDQKIKLERSDVGGRLMALSLQEGAKAQQVAVLASLYNDFTPDSQALIYATTDMPSKDTVTLGSIERRAITAGENGKLDIGNAERLAGIVYSPDTKIVCLDDGRILFSTFAISLPMAEADQGTRFSLFSLSPNERATIAPMLTRSAETSAPMDGFNQGIFDVRPDGRAVTLLGAHKDEGKVGYYEFASGNVRYVFPEDQDTELLEQPEWRDNDEISLIVPAGHEWGTPDRPELVLYSISKQTARCISTNWPDALMKTWANKDQSSTRTGDD